MYQFGVNLSATTLDGTPIPTKTPADVKRLLSVVVAMMELTANVTEEISVTTPRDEDDPAPHTSPPVITHQARGITSQRPKTSVKRTMPQWIDVVWEESGKPATGLTASEFYRIAVDKCGFVSTARNPVEAFGTSLRQHPDIKVVGSDGKASLYGIPGDTNRTQQSMSDLRDEVFLDDESVEEQS